MDASGTSIQRREHQDNSDVYYQPLPELVPEEQDVHADHDGYQRERWPTEKVAGDNYLLLAKMRFTCSD